MPDANHLRFVLSNAQKEDVMRTFDTLSGMCAAATHKGIGSGEHSKAWIDGYWIVLRRM